MVGIVQIPPFPDPLSETWSGAGLYLNASSHLHDFTMFAGG